MIPNTLYELSDGRLGQKPSHTVADANTGGSLADPSHGGLKFGKCQNRPVQNDLDLLGVDQGGRRPVCDGVCSICEEGLQLGQYDDEVADFSFD